MFITLLPVIYLFDKIILSTDPEEQGCDIFRHIPGSITLLSGENTEDTEKKEEQENPTVLDISSVDGSSKCQNTLDTDKENSLTKLENTENSSNESNSSSQQKSNDLKVHERVEGVSSSKESESVVESDPVRESDIKLQEASTTLSSKETTEISTVKESAKQDSESDSEGELKDLVFEMCESDMLDLFEVEGQPYKYHFLPDVLTHLKMDYKEFVMSAKTVETLELSVKEFESRAHSCIVGSGKRDIVNSCSRVVLVRVTPAIEKILGIETFKL